MRGAYLTRETRLAAALGVPSPVHGSIQETHDCYNGCAAFLLDRVRRGSASVMLATHNVESGKSRPGSPFYSSCPDKTSNSSLHNVSQLN